MPSNAQRRQAAKRKLERQLARRAERERKRRQRNIGLTALGVIVAIGVGVTLWAVNRGDDESATTATGETEQSSEFAAMPTGRAEPLPELLRPGHQALGGRHGKSRGLRRGAFSQGRGETPRSRS